MHCRLVRIFLNQILRIFTKLTPLFHENSMSFKEDAKDQKADVLFSLQDTVLSTCLLQSTH